MSDSNLKSSKILKLNSKTSENKNNQVIWKFYKYLILIPSLFQYLLETYATMITYVKKMAFLQCIENSVRFPSTVCKKKFYQVQQKIMYFPKMKKSYGYSFPFHVHECGNIPHSHEINRLKYTIKKRFQNW